MTNNEDRENRRKMYQNEDTSDKTYIPAVPKSDPYEKDRAFRVCAYCRVSTDNDEQLSSFELQQAHYRHLAEKHPNWDLKHIFADEGISGTSTKKREDFNEMIEACLKGEYDLIVTKSVSRFARNLVDCISLIRKLKVLTPPVGVFFGSISGKCGSKNRRIQRLCRESVLTLSLRCRLIVGIVPTFGGNCGGIVPPSNRLAARQQPFRGVSPVSGEVATKEPEGMTDRPCRCCPTITLESRLVSR